MADVVQRVRPAIVTVVTPTAQGSGFHIGDGRIVTNYHVIDGAERAEVRTADGFTLPIHGVTAIDRRRDLAVLVVSKPLNATLRLGADRTRAGTEVIALGTPRGLEFSVTTGIISAVRTVDDVMWVQHTAPISPGSSGGPLLTSDGTVVGVNTFFSKDGQNLNFASSLHDLQLVIAQREAFVPLPELVQRSRPQREASTPTGELAVLCSKGVSDACACRTERGAECYDLAMRLIVEVASPAARRLAAYANQLACEAGVPKACWMVGGAYDYGEGVEKDIRFAAAAYNRACALGVADACVRVGILYEKQSPPDYFSSTQMYAAACTLDNGFGCWAYAGNLQQQLGATRDIRAAARFHQRACDLGEMAGCVELGAMYLEGSGVRRSNKAALRLFEMACRQGEREGCARAKLVGGR